MDWNAIQQYLPLYQKAAVLTVRLGVAGIIFAIIIGLACAVIQYDKVPVLRKIVGVYIQLSRNTPLLVQLFFIYYGLPKVGIRTNAEICGIVWRFWAVATWPKRSAAVWKPLSPSRPRVPTALA